MTSRDHKDAQDKAAENKALLRHIYTELDERRDGVGLIVMAGYRRAVVDLREMLARRGPALRVIVAGDALAPRTLLDAVAEGARAGAEA